MSDGRAQNGGARAGAGRKAKRDEDDLKRRLKKACKDGKRDLLDEALRMLALDMISPSQKTRAEARKLFMAYWYGKPVERHEVTGEGGGPVEAVSMTLEEWRKRAGDRAAQANEAMADFEGEDA